MKNSNENIYMTSPIALMASIVSSAENSVNPDYRMEAENMVKFYSDLSNNSTVTVCEAFCADLMSEEDTLIVFNAVFSGFGTISSYTVHKFNNETSLYKLECSKGVFKMILVLDSENRVSAIDFIKFEASEISVAA